MDTMIFFWVFMIVWYLCVGAYTCWRTRSAITHWRTVAFILMVWPAFWAFVSVMVGVDVVRALRSRKGRRGR